MPSRLGYAILFVSDLDRAISFYRDVVGLPLRFRADAYAEFATEGTKFALFPRSELPVLIGRHAPPDPAPWPQGELAFFVEDVDAEYERLRRMPVPMLAPPTDRPWGERTLHIADPDGNLIELTRAKRPARSGALTMFLRQHAPPTPQIAGPAFRAPHNFVPLDSATCSARNSRIARCSMAVGGVGGSRLSDSATFAVDG